MRFVILIGLSALVACASASQHEEIHSIMSEEMGKHQDLTKNKTISELAAEIMKETRAIGHEIVGYVKKAVRVHHSNATENSTEPSRHSRMLKDFVNFFVPSEHDMERAAREESDTSLSSLLSKITGINYREMRAEGAKDAKAAPAEDKPSTDNAAASNETDTAAVKSGYGGGNNNYARPPAPASYNPVPVYSSVPQVNNYRPPQNNYQPPPQNNYQPPPQNNYQQPPQNNYQQPYTTPAAYTTPGYTTPPYTTPYTTAYTTPYYTTTTTTSTTTAKPAPPVLIPIPGPPGPPGPPGLMGLPGLPGKTPNLAGLKAILLSKLSKLLLLIKAVAILCLLKFGGLLGLILGLVLPLYGKLKKAGVVLPLEPETKDYDSYGSTPSNDYGPPPSGSYAPMSQQAVDDLTNYALPSIDAADAKYGAPSPQPVYSAPAPAPAPQYSAPTSKVVKRVRNK